LFIQGTEWRNPKRSKPVRRHSEQPESHCAEPDHNDRETERPRVAPDQCGEDPDHRPADADQHRPGLGCPKVLLQIPTALFTSIVTAAVG